jgi:alpha-glucosidase (family GH31 glycosyl hydrolase)
VWNRELFPDPDAFVKDMRVMDFEINLWENPFVDIRSPLFEPLKSRSGDYGVYNGHAYPTMAGSLANPYPVRQSSTGQTNASIRLNS